MDNRGQIKFGIVLITLFLIFLAIISAISSNLSNQTDFYTNSSFLEIDLRNHFLQEVKSYSLVVEGDINTEVLDNKLIIRGIKSNSNITLVLLNQNNLTKKFSIYFNESFLEFEENLTLVNYTELFAINNNTYDGLNNSSNIVNETFEKNLDINISQNLTESLLDNSSIEIGENDSDLSVIKNSDREITLLDAGSTLYWVGNSSSLWSNSISWSTSSGGVGGAGVPDATTAVIFDENNKNNSVIDENFGGSIYSLNVSIGYNGIIESKLGWNTSLNVSENVWISNGTLTHGDNTNNETWRVYLNVGGNFTLEEGGVINVTGKGYDTKKGPGAGLIYAQEASYGGIGNENPRLPYGSFNFPTNLGSGGGSSPGGGAILLNISLNSLIDGSILSEGATSTYYTGTGGSILIYSETILGNGYISSMAGFGSQGLSGSGGRISIILTNATNLDNIQINCTGHYSAWGGHLSSPGTIYLKNLNYPNGELIIQGVNRPSTNKKNVQINDGTFYNFNDTIFTFDIINLTNSANLEIQNFTLNLTNTLFLTNGKNESTIKFNSNSSHLILPPNTFNITGIIISQRSKSKAIWNTSVYIGSGGILTHEDNSQTETHKLNLVILGNLTIGTDGKIDANGKGYGANSGPGRPLSGSDTGGSYGGIGNTYESRGIPGNTYGSIVNPTDLGSGGQSTPGGGAIILNVSEGVFLSGIICAEGTDGGLNSIDAGSGGSVFLVTSFLNGNGNILVNGGTDLNYAAVGNGGGGRIAITLINDTDFDNISFNSYGGNPILKGSSVFWGAAGTIYLKTANQTHGTLIIDNNGISTTTTTTLISENVTDAAVGDIIIKNGGKLNISAYNSSLGIFPSLTIYGDINKTNGNFSTGTNSTIILTGSENSTIYSNEGLTFYNLNITKQGSYVFFPSNILMNVSGEFNVLGSSGNLTYLRSNTTGTRWKINSFSNNVNYANVQDSNNTGTEIYAGYSVDSLNNSNWTFFQGEVDLISPSLGFVEPTPLNGTTQNYSSIYVNLTSNDSQNNISTFIDFDNSLVAWWRMDDVNSSGDPIDYTGRNNGSKKGDAHQILEGKMGKGFILPGGSLDKISTPPTLSQYYSNSFTLSLWVKFNNNLGSMIYSDGGGYNDGATGMYIAKQSGSNNFLCPVSNGTLREINSLTNSISLADTNWHNLVFVISLTNKNKSLYVDGIFQSSALTVTGTINHTSIGSIAGTFGSDYFNGSIDDVMIFNRSLSAVEIQALYANTSSKYLELNFTNLSNKNYSFKAYTQDIAGNVNLTERSIIVDAMNPNASILLPENNKHLNNGTYNFTLNVNDNNGLKNATLWIFNASGVWNSFSQTISGTAGIISQVVTGLIDGVYRFFWQVFDLAGNQISTSNQTVTVDLTFPLVSFEDPTPENDSGRNGEFIINASIFDLNLRNVSYSYNGSSISIMNYSSNYQLKNISSLLEGLVLFMDFENRSEYGENDSYIGDYSGLGNNGTVYGDAFVNMSGGRYGGGLQLDGSGDYVDVGNDSNLNINSSFTLFAWFKTNSTAQQEIIAKKSVGAQATPWWSLAIVNGVIQLDCDDNIIKKTIISSGGYADNNWHHISALRNSSGYFIYIDSILNGSGTNNGDISWYYNLTIGSDTYSAPYPFNGSIDDVMIFNRSLSTDEIKQLYHSQISKYYAQENNYTLNYVESKNFTSSLGNATINLTSNDLLMQNFNLIVSQTSPAVGLIGRYLISVTDLAGNTNSTEIRTVNGNTNPNFVSVTNTPSSMDELDPNVNITFLVNVSDVDNNLDYVYMQWKNSSSNWINQTIENLTSKGIYNNLYSLNFSLPNYEDNITYQFIANDSVGAIEYSDNYTLSVFWDCTWNSTQDLGAVAGYDINKGIGNITISNTGDVEYANNNCSLEFRVSYNLDEGRIYYDGEYVKNYQGYTIPAKDNRTISINATFSTVIKEENIDITLEEFRGRSNSRYNNISLILITMKSGPYLYQRITSSPLSVYLTPGNFLIEAYLRNLMGSLEGNENNTAFNVSSYWNISEEFELVNGNETQNYSNISDNNLNYRIINLSFSNLAAATSGQKEFTLSSYGYDFLGNFINDTVGNQEILNSVNITFLCYPISDGICVEDCGYSQDPDCEKEVVTIVTPGSGGGGGGGGTGTSVRTEATFELKRGEEAEFELVISNNYSRYLKDLNIFVSGVNSEYLELNPKKIDLINPYESKIIKVKVNAPSYFTLSEYILFFDIQGEVELNKSSSRYSETRYVKLRILELSRKEADELLNKSYEYLSKLNSTTLKNEISSLYPLNLGKVISLIKKAELAYENNDFSSLKKEAQSIKVMYDSAIKSIEIISDLYEKIDNSEKRGIFTGETKKVLYLAETAFSRGEFELALQRCEEAKLTYALETKGEFNILYAIKDKPVHFAAIIFFSATILGASSLIFRLRLYKRKLKMLNEEETLLLELMKVVQKECFENNTMSMEEYRAAMSQYEKRLSATIEDKIQTETKISYLLKIRGKRKALKIEQKRLSNLVKKLQDNYLNKGKIETRVYEGMLKSYSSRILDVEEKLAYLDAEDAGVGKSWYSRFFRRFKK